MDSVINRLWLHAAVMSRCSRSWMALCEPQPRHFMFVTYQNGHFGNSGLAVGSIKKYTTVMPAAIIRMVVFPI